jgi:hypothetical protein
VAKKFITTRELRLIDSWNKELIQGVVQQEIIYYAISYEESKVHDVYDEAIEKEYLQPVRINARVEFEQLASKVGGAGIDSNYRVSVSLHHQECEERNLKPREGDFIEFGQVVFEISTVAWAEPVYGQMNDKLSYKLTCVPSREGQFKADNVTADAVDNTHPVEPARPRTLGDDL